MNYRIICHFLGRIMGGGGVADAPRLGISLYQREMEAVRGF